MAHTRGYYDHVFMNMVSDRLLGLQFMSARPGADCKPDGLINRYAGNPLSIHVDDNSALHLTRQNIPAQRRQIGQGGIGHHVMQFCQGQV